MLACKQVRQREREREGVGGRERQRERRGDMKEWKDFVVGDW